MRLLVAVCLLFVCAGSARAGDDNTAKVRILYDSGTTHYNLGEFKQALADYKEAYRLKHDAAFLFNIGQAARMLGDHEEAARSYRAYLREAKSTPNRPEVEKFIEDAEAALAAKRKAAPPTGVVSPQLPATTRSNVSPDLRSPNDFSTPAPAKEPPRSNTPIIIAVVVAAVVVVGAAVGIGVAVASAPKPPSTTLGTLSVVFP